jgi:hypothetical protein
MLKQPTLNPQSTNEPRLINVRIRERIEWLENVARDRHGLSEYLHMYGPDAEDPPRCGLRVGERTRGEEQLCEAEEERRAREVVRRFAGAREFRDRLVLQSRGCQCAGGGGVEEGERRVERRVEWWAGPVRL